VVTRESLLKWKTQYNWPPCANLSRSTSFNIANETLLHCYKTSYLNEEVISMEPSLSLSVSLVRYPVWGDEMSFRSKMNRWFEFLLTLYVLVIFVFVISFKIKVFAVTSIKSFAVLLWRQEKNTSLETYFIVISFPVNKLECLSVASLFNPHSFDL
jgi:hypothetical protein